MAAAKPTWNLYMIRCGDGSLYTGITTDVERRLLEHMNVDGSGRGAKFLRGRQPLTLVYQTQLQNRSEAQQLEYTVKQLSKLEKEAIVNHTLSLHDLVVGETAP